MTKGLKVKGYNVIPEHSLCRQCVKRYDNIIDNDKKESDVEQNESDNYYSCETPRKDLITSLEPMGISPVHLNGVVQHGRGSTA